ncbi:AfsR/SARP family transcriptional regulator [Nonomuraea sp. NPDC052634]|uniref:AfsR/SARP family transcriptional regulator n=1 Tax=Nonomuraea sp. NPDC052634 TaxID=3155813 RepID=UPI0034189CAD
MSQLRRALGDRELVAYRPPGYALLAEPEAVDAGLFASLLQRARRTAGLEERAALLRQALDLWRGPAFAEFASAPFALAAVSRLDEQRLVAYEELAETRLGLGEHALVAAELADLVAAHPLRERLRAAHIRALYGAGRPGEALAGYQDLRRRLAGELGLDPGPELVELSRSPRRSPPCSGCATTRPARSRTACPPRSPVGRRCSCWTTASTSSSRSPSWPGGCCGPHRSCACWPPARSRCASRARPCTPCRRSTWRRPSSCSPPAPRSAPARAARPIPTWWRSARGWTASPSRWSWPPRACAR